MASSSARYRPEFVYFEPYSTASRLLNRATTAGTLQTDAVVYTTVPFQNQQDVAKGAPWKFDARGAVASLLFDRIEPIDWCCWLRPISHLSWHWLGCRW